MTGDKNRGMGKTLGGNSGVMPEDSAERSERAFKERQESTKDVLAFKES